MKNDTNLNAFKMYLHGTEKKIEVICDVCL